MAAKQGDVWHSAASLTCLVVEEGAAAAAAAALPLVSSPATAAPGAHITDVVGAAAPDSASQFSLPMHFTSYSGVHSHMTSAKFFSLLNSLLLVSVILKQPICLLFGQCLPLCVNVVSECPSAINAVF